jgi:hypothetical protein
VIRGGVRGDLMIVFACLFTFLTRLQYFRDLFSPRYTLPSHPGIIPDIRTKGSMSLQNSAQNHTEYASEQI